MHGLGKIQSSNQVFGVNKLTLKTTVADKRGGIRGIQPKNAPATSMSTEAVDISAPLKERLDRELKSPENPAGALNTRLDALRKSLPEWVREILAAIAEAEQEAVLSKRDTQLANSRIDLTFGVEPLSYKNMWKVLKTVVREIGDIKDAHHGRFFLGVNKRLDEPTMLMEFDSLADYLEESPDTPLKNTLSGASKRTAELMASDPVTIALLQAQANIMPEVALQLLTWA